MSEIWPLSRTLLTEVLADRITDRFIATLVWQRLGYQKVKTDANLWVAGPTTSDYWYEKFPEAPEIISQRKASVHLTRSIDKQYKQSLKEILNFQGYRIGELYPRRTRRATAVNWLLAWCLVNEIVLPQKDSLPPLQAPPIDPAKGHPGDLPIF